MNGREYEKERQFHGYEYITAGDEGLNLRQH